MCGRSGTLLQFVAPDAFKLEHGETNLTDYLFNKHVIHHTFCKTCGIKPFAQKGSGRARAGTIRSPLWRHGGKIFAAKPRDFEQKVNRKMYRGAIASVLSELIRQERLVLIEEFGVDAPKTKQLVGKLKQLGLDNVLIVKDAVDENLFLAARNLAGVDVTDTTALDPVSLIRFEKVLITVPALKRVEEWLA